MNRKQKNWQTINCDMETKLAFEAFVTSMKRAKGGAVSQDEGLRGLLEAATGADKQRREPGPRHGPIPAEPMTHAEQSSVEKLLFILRSGQPKVARLVAGLLGDFKELILSEEDGEQSHTHRAAGATKRTAAAG
jgi:hypothetical protein